MKMFLRDNLMHGDLHGGNVMYNVESNEMTVIDAGITCTLTDDGPKEFVRFLYGMCTAKPAVVSKSLLKMAESTSELDLPTFNADIHNAVDMFVDTQTGESRVSGPAPVGDITGEI